MVRDGAEREDVELFPRRAALGHRLGRHVDPGRLFHERIQTARSRGGRSGRAGVERLPRAGLPVEDPDPRLRRLRVDHQDALRRQRTVDQVLRMGVAQGIGELPEQVEARIDVELGAPFGEPVIEALGAVAVLEDERRAENVLGVPLGRENALVPNVAQDLVLAPGRTLQRRPLVVRGRLGDGIDPDPCPLALDRRVEGRPVLVVGAFEQQLVEPVVAHAPGALRRANAGFLHGAADRLGHRPVGLRADRRPCAVPGESRDDPGPLVAPGAGVAEMHPVAQVLRETAVDILVRQKDVRLQERAGSLPLQRRLAAQERDQLLRLAVRQQQRVVHRLNTTAAAPRPCPLVALHDSGPALDLDEIEALRSQDEQIDLVDRPVVGNELEVRPRAVGVVIVQPVAHERERVPLPRELGVRDRLPAGRGGIHGADRRTTSRSRGIRRAEF